MIEKVGEMIEGKIVDTYGESVGEAITNVCYALEKAEGVTAIILQEHLKRLCDIQCAKLTAIHIE